MDPVRGNGPSRRITNASSALPRAAQKTAPLDLNIRNHALCWQQQVQHCWGHSSGSDAVKEAIVRIRAIVFEDNASIRSFLQQLLNKRGYEVFAFPTPAVCPLHRSETCYHSCSDIVISDVSMPLMNGLQFVDEQIQRGCRIKNLALMSGSWTPEDMENARALGCHVIQKPFTHAEINEWLDACEKKIDPERVLDDALLADHS